MSRGTRTALVVFSTVLMALPTASASDGMALDLEAQVLDLGLLGKLSAGKPGDPAYSFDSASGFSARLHAYYAHAYLDYKHFYARGLDWMGAGLGYELELPATRRLLDLELSCQLRAGAGFLALRSAPAAQGAGGDAVEMGGNVFGKVAMELDITDWLVGGVTFAASFVWVGKPGFHISLTAGVAIKI